MSDNPYASPTTVESHKSRPQLRPQLRPLRGILSYLVMLVVTGALVGSGLMFCYSFFIMSPMWGPRLYKGDDRVETILFIASTLLPISVIAGIALALVGYAFVPPRRPPGDCDRYVLGDSAVLGQLLDQIRDYYVSCFIDTINEHSVNDGVTVVHEPAFCNATGEVVTEGQLSLPARGDLLIIRDGAVSDSVRIDTDGMLSFEPITFAWSENTLNVDLRPFQWNWMELRIFGLKADADWTPIRDWFIDWFQENDPADDELLGGVHFLSDPESGHDYSQVSIDLGTAPVESFEDLLDAIGQMGATRVQIGQFEEGT